MKINYTMYGTGVDRRGKSIAGNRKTTLLKEGTKFSLQLLGYPSDTYWIPLNAKVNYLGEFSDI